jgi:DNA-binding CsgD family transcriptional regulator
MAVVPIERTRDELVRLAHRGLGVREFSLAAARAVRRSVPFDGVCVVSLDPATLLPTGHVMQDALPESTLARYLEIELREPDANKFTDLARGRRRAAALSAATDGALDLSARHRELRGPNGFGDELRAALVGDASAWGAIVLLRAAGEPDFEPTEARRLAALSRAFAEGLRRGLFLTALSDTAHAAPDAGLLVLAADDTVQSANDAAQQWLDELGADPSPGALLPLVIRGVALRARAAVVEDGPANAQARVRTPAGRWLLARGTLLGDGPDAPAAVMLEPAGSPELAPLIAEAYGLTSRERTVTQLIAQGHSTNEVAERLYVSPHTVHDHLKSIFEKTGVGTRGELVAELFFQHYVPRLANGTPAGPSGFFTDAREARRAA